ncbi:hypothetical protein [Achromobacter spanius]|jgi:hypothetical protein|uniref:Terminase n=2 Tax=Achromobacter TaxID=222 RepID=A0AA42LVE9_9BURK|nr:hypothetical protein [Achromobacter spanius]MDH0740211.1 hypothetical protein [Achromobacter spanius]
MARPRLPVQKADASGAALKNPGRHAGRTRPKGTRPLGLPYKQMTAAQKKAWKEFASEMSWLNSSHRVLLRLACIWVARMDDPDADFGVSATQALSSILSKLGATPVDESKVAHDDGGEDDPDEKFFKRG